MKHRSMILAAVLICACILPPLTLRGETVSNGAVTMFNVGEYVVGLLLHQEKKILIYRISTAPNNISLKSVRTWHYDVQYANTLKTLLSDGMYPKTLDSKNGPMRLHSYFTRKKDEAFDFNPGYQIPGLSGGGTSSGGGDLSLAVEFSGNQGTLIILDAKHSALVTYRVTEQTLEHMGTRSILLDAQIPIAYPQSGGKNPLYVRKELLALKDALNRKFEKESRNNPDFEKAVPFEVEDLPVVQKILEAD